MSYTGLGLAITGGLATPIGGLVKAPAVATTTAKIDVGIPLTLVKLYGTFLWNTAMGMGMSDTTTRPVILLVGSALKNPRVNSFGMVDSAPVAKALNQLTAATRTWLSNFPAAPKVNQLLSDIAAGKYEGHVQAPALHIAALKAVSTLGVAQVSAAAAAQAKAAADAAAAQVAALAAAAASAAQQAAAQLAAETKANLAAAAARDAAATQAAADKAVADAAAAAQQQAADATTAAAAKAAADAAAAANALITNACPAGQLWAPPGLDPTTQPGHCFAPEQEQVITPNQMTPYVDNSQPAIGPNVTDPGHVPAPSGGVQKWMLYAGGAAVVLGGAWLVFGGKKSTPNRRRARRNRRRTSRRY